MFGKQKVEEFAGGAAIALAEGMRKVSVVVLAAAPAGNCLVA